MVISLPMISLCPPTPCIKHYRDMLEVHSMWTWGDEWYFTRQVTHRRRGKLLGGPLRPRRRYLANRWFITRPDTNVCLGDLLSPWEVSLGLGPVGLALREAGLYSGQT